MFQGCLDAGVRRTPTFILCLSIVLALGALPADAQTATALVKEGQVLGTAGTVNSINNPAVNGVGGFSVQVNTNNGTTTLSHIWGNATGGSGALLMTEGTFNGYIQTAFESFNGLNDRGEPCYGVTATSVATGVTGLDGVFLDFTPILMEQEPVPSMPGQFSVFNSRPGCTDSDIYWVGGIAPTPTGSTQNRVLFAGSGALPRLKGGDVIGGILVPHVTSGMDFDVRLSRLSTHYIIDAQVTGSTANDRVVVVDGAAIAPGGGFAREGLPVPAAIGGLAGENWANFDFMGITQGGRVFFTGDTSAATSVDEFVFDNGQIVLREGTVLSTPGGNYTLSGDIEGGYQNRQGDWAVTWDANSPTAVNVEILLVNGRMVLKEGDLVDLSGDGVPEPNAKLADFTGISALVIGPRQADGSVDLYFTADVDTLGTTTSTDDTEALLRLRVPSGVANQLPVASCQDRTVTAGEGCVAEASIDAGSSDADDDPLTREQTPAGPYGIGTTSVLLTVTDVQGATDVCQATVTVLSACDDGNACTVDACDPEDGCSNEPLDCDDGNACTTDSCDPDEGCLYEKIVCDDESACTADSCEPASGCVYAPISCDDGDACTADSCDADTGCAHAPVVCDDANACTSDSCEPASGCVYTPISCDDGDACTADSCDPDTGCAYAPVSCDDGNACTADSCDPATGCNQAPIDPDDGNACTIDTCDPASGTHHEPVDCADGNACTNDSCDPATGCVHVDPGVAEPNPRTTGYWKRLCQGPHSGDELTAADAACVASQGGTFSGVGSVEDLCAVLGQGGEGGTCGHTEIDLLALALNVCHLRVCGGNAIASQYGTNDTVGESYAEADAILSDPDRDHASCLEAKGLLEEINTGRALNLDTVTFARLAGGTVRLTWQPPFAIVPVKYNVWRREAGSLAPFQKIGETATPVFDDATPGDFEYDITPVR
jgi:hypothetical protein